jgi:hypothetical protein
VALVLGVGHYCRICQRTRANERFTGRGHRDHICKDWQRLPREDRDRIERLDELFGFLRQSNISAKNITRLETLRQNPAKDISELANLLLEVARVKPDKRRRWSFLAQHRPDLCRHLRIILGDDHFEFDSSNSDTDLSAGDEYPDHKD